jgi:(p)ppGpp synthase/HD superfamily hydrolase
MNELLEKARAFAEKAHGDQKYGKQPYMVHVDAVAGVLLQRFQGPEADKEEIQELIAAAYLHDTLEDTDTTREDLVREFGDAVAMLVDAVTDGKGKNRKERKQRPYKLIPMVRWSLFLKLADRVANVEAAKAEGREDLVAMYRKEQPEFQFRLLDSANSIGEQALFSRLNRLLETEE